MNTASLRSALKRALEIIDNPHYHDSCGSRPADHPAVDDIREALNIGYSHSGSGDLGYASVFARRGYSKGMEMVPEDRRIQVSKNFPAIAV